MDEQDVKDNDNNQQEQSGNMYSYRNDNVNIKQSEAIRRSLGEGNPSGYPQNKFGSNPNNYNNDNDGSNSLNISQKSSESSSHTESTVNEFLFTFSRRCFNLMSSAAGFDFFFEGDVISKQHSSAVPSFSSRK